MLKGYSAQLAKRKAPPAAEKTEASKGALMPRDPVIVTANSRSKTLLKSAVLRVCQPSISRISRRVSAQVATTSRAGIAALRKNQLKFFCICDESGEISPCHVRLTECSPQPNRSVTTDRKENKVQNAEIR